MQALSRVDTESEPELVQPKRFSSSWLDSQGLVGPVWHCRRKILATGAVLLGVVGVASLRFNNQCINLGALQGKSEAGIQGQGATAHSQFEQYGSVRKLGAAFFRQVDIDAQILKTANKLKNAARWQFTLSVTA